jgi:hypothetical protein
MKKYWVMFALAVVLLTGMSGPAGAAVQFTFDSLNSSSTSGTINAYMTNLYGSQVIVTGAEIGQGSWSGNSTPYLWTASGADGNFEINFVSQPISKLYGTTMGYVFDTTDGADFSLRAYGSNFGSAQSPNSSALVYSQSWNASNDGTVIDIPDVVFSGPVSLLVFSDDGKHDVGIDSLKVETGSVTTSVPEPATILLLGLGLFGFGACRRTQP